MDNKNLKSSSSDNKTIIKSSSLSRDGLVVGSKCRIYVDHDDESNWFNGIVTQIFQTPTEDDLLVILIFINKSLYLFSILFLFHDDIQPINVYFVDL